MAKDHNEAEMERQRSAMIGRGAGHNEIHNPNQVAEFNRTGKVAHERQSKGSGGSGCVVLLFAAGFGALSGTIVFLI